MKRDADSRRAVQIIGNFVVQATARGDISGMLEHLAVYMAAVKALKRQESTDQG